MENYMTIIKSLNPRAQLWDYHRHFKSVYSKVETEIGKCSYSAVDRPNFGRHYE